MTLQTSEVYFYNGEELYSYETPLAYHPKKPKFEPLGSFCWRGYRGTWSIRDGKLYLVDLYAHIPHIKETQETQFLKYDFVRRDFYYEIKREPLAVTAHLEDVFPEVEDGGRLGNLIVLEFQLGSVCPISRGRCGLCALCQGFP